MVSSEQRQAYLLWQAERGQRYPLLRARRPRALFVCGGPLSENERSLLDKMIGAMRLPAASFVVAEGAIGQVPWAADLVVVLGEENTASLEIGAESWQDMRGRVMNDARLATKLLLTFHPRDLLLDPGRKRLAWEDLQAGMRALNLL